MYPEHFHIIEETTREFYWNGYSRTYIGVVLYFTRRQAKCWAFDYRKTTPHIDGTSSRNSLTHQLSVLLDDCTLLVDLFVNVVHITIHGIEMQSVPTHFSCPSKIISKKSRVLTTCKARRCCICPNTKEWQASREPRFVFPSPIR
jgi:hypothetical protein